MKNIFLDSAFSVFTWIQQHYRYLYIYCSLIVIHILAVVSCCIMVLVLPHFVILMTHPLGFPVFYSVCACVFAYIHSISFYNQVVMWLDNGKIGWVTLAGRRQIDGKVCPKTEMGMCVSLWLCSCVPVSLHCFSLLLGLMLIRVC